MGLGDKTATARRPELAGQPTARSVNPSSKRYLQTHTPGEGPALRPALHHLRSESARPHSHAQTPVHPPQNLAYNPIMATLRPDTLAASLARIFEGRMIDRASWFALTGGEPLFSEGDPSDTAT